MSSTHDISGRQELVFCIMSVTDETSFLGMGDRLALKKTQDWSVIGLSAGLVSLDT